MLMRCAVFCLLSAMAVVGLLDSNQALAADLATQQAAPPLMTRTGLVSELRLGLFAHDPASPESGSADINVEFLSVRPFVVSDPLLAVLMPRIHLGGTVNTAGDTSHAYAGLTWTYDITTTLFVEASLGIAIHNGKTGQIVPADRAALGCSPLIRESGSIGYRIDGNWSIMATIEHISNAGLCDRNRGLTNYGVRLGYTF